MGTLLVEDGTKSGDGRRRQRKQGRREREEGGEREGVMTTCALVMCVTCGFWRSSTQCTV